MKILVVAGTRPEAIKVAPVVKELQKYSCIETILCNTGQHREMIQQAFADFNICSDIELDVMRENQSLASLSSSLFTKIDEVLQKENPDLILVQGDTTTVMVCALSAFYRHIKIGHIEAGLRSFDKFAPFPEEVNREIVSRVADLHFAPTTIAYANILKEGIDPDNVFVTGNTVIDSLYYMRDEIKNNKDYLDKRVVEKMAEGKKIILVTGHRRENLGSGFIEICQAIKLMAEKYEDIVFFYPVHLNPKVQEPVLRILGNHPHIILSAPLTYKNFIAHLNICNFVLTDSGGIQEEAPALGKPVLIMRDVTERPEGVKAGVAKLVGPHRETIIKNVSELLENETVYKKMSSAKNPYGDGNASNRIVSIIINKFLTCL